MTPVVTAVGALASGAVTLLAFPPYNLWWLALIGPACWFALNTGTSARHAFWLGILYGIGLLVPGLYWVHHSMSAFAGTPYLIAAVLAVVLALLMAVYYGLAGWLSAKWTIDRTPRARFLALTAFVTLSEWLRGWLFTGFPWILIGYTQIDTPLAGYAPIGGVLLVSLATYLTAALIASFAHPGVPIRTLSMALIVAICTGGMSLQSIEWTQPKGDNISVVMVQGNIPQDQKWLPENRLSTLSFYAEKTLAHLDNADIIIWPESAIPDLLANTEEELIIPLNKHLVSASATLVTGVLTHPLENTYYNSILATGREQHFYHKRHLVPFGEYFPLGWLWKDLVSGLATMGDDFSAGQADKPLLQVGAHRAGVSICYEIVFSEEIRQSLPSADFLLNLSNDAWFGQTNGPQQHFQMARMRALENGRMLLRSTNTGITAVIASNGKVINQLPQFRTDVLSTEIRSYEGMTPYARYGLLATSTGLAGLLLAARLLRRNVRRG